MLFLALLLLLVAALVGAIYLHDTRQTQHTILRNFPVIGHVRYFAETWGEYMRQYQYLPDWAERPFNRLERSWVYRSAKGVSNLISFGSENVPRFVFRNAAFPVLDEEKQALSPASRSAWPRGPAPAASPTSAQSFFNISRHELRRAEPCRGDGAVAAAPSWPASGWHRRGRAGARTTWKAAATSSCRSAPPNTACAMPTGTCRRTGCAKSPRYPQVRMFEVKLAQGAKPGKGGILPAAKVNAGDRRDPRHPGGP